jgi:dihydropteroate synthase
MARSKDMASKDYKTYATKDITPAMEAFAEWLREVTGYKVDPRTVALAGSLRADFQSSDFWKADARNTKSNAEANKAARAKEVAERARAAADKAVARARIAEDKAEAAAKAVTSNQPKPAA